MDKIFASIEDAVAEIRAGKMIIVTDNEDRENEGDFVMAADKVTPEAVNFMTIYGRGLLCQAITAERAQELELTPMVRENTSSNTTAFTVSVDAQGSTTTGISAFDRAATIKTIANPASRPADLLRPGHIFPLIAKNGGVLTRDGHTEATTDIARLAGFTPTGILCEILNADGTMARLPELIEIARQHNLKIITVESLIAWRRKHETARRLTESSLPSAWGDFRLVLYENPESSRQPHIAIIAAREADKANMLVRVHSECFTGDVLRSAHCDCGAQLDQAMRRIAAEGGMVIYLRQEGRGIGLTEKIRAYNLQDMGHDTVDANIKLGHEADQRDYTIAAEILRDLGVTGIRLMTNNPAKEAGLRAAGIAVHERTAIEISPGEKNRKYLETKKSRLGHDLKLV